MQDARCRVPGGVAKVRSCSPSVRLSVRLSASRTQPSMARPLELTRTRSNDDNSRGSLSRISLRHRRSRCLAREHEGRNLAVPNPILRAPHDVADVLYYRLTKVMWRRLAAGARQSWREQENDLGGERWKEKERKKKKIKDASERTRGNFTLASSLSFYLPPLIIFSPLPRSTNHYLRYSTFFPVSRSPIVSCSRSSSRARLVIVEEGGKRQIGDDDTHPHGVKPSRWKPRWQRGRPSYSHRKRQ